MAWGQGDKMGKVKSEYEKILDEFYEIETEIIDIPEDELDLEALLGNEYRHVVNHFAAEEDLNELSSELIDEYEEAYSILKEED